MLMPPGPLAQVSFLTAVLMGVALTFHSLLEGAALGAQQNVGGSLHIFIAIQVLPRPPPSKMPFGPSFGLLSDSLLGYPVAPRPAPFTTPSNLSRGSPFGLSCSEAQRSTWDRD